MEYPQLTHTVNYDLWVEENQEELDIIASETGQDRELCYDPDEFQTRVYEERQDITSFNVLASTWAEVVEIFKIVTELKGEAFECDYKENRLYGYIFVNSLSKLEEQVNAKGITCKIRKEF